MASARSEPTAGKRVMRVARIHEDRATKLIAVGNIHSDHAHPTTYPTCFLHVTAPCEVNPENHKIKTSDALVASR